MAKFYPTSSSQTPGVSSDDVTITSLDVPESKTALTSDSNDEVIKGKLKEFSSASEAVSSLDSENDRVQMAIPTRGLYSASSKLFASFSSIANLIGLAASKIASGETILGVTGTFKGKGDAKAADVRLGKSFSTAELSNAIGTMREHEGGTITPGTSDVRIDSDQYLAGDLVLKGDPNLIAANIRKNVVIFGIKGESDGWVFEETDMYNAGDNAYSFTELNGSDLVTFESDHIAIKKNFSKAIYLVANKEIDMFKYTKLNFEYTVTELSAPSYPNTNFQAIIKESPDSSASMRVLGSIQSRAIVGQKVKATINLTIVPESVSKVGYLQFNFYNGDSTGYTPNAKFHRIWLSMD